MSPEQAQMRLLKGQKHIYLMHFAAGCIAPSVVGAGIHHPIEESLGSTLLIGKCTYIQARGDALQAVCLGVHTPRMSELPGSMDT